MNARKDRGCLKIAFYGKGGIGKSTVASNVSAALSMQGFKTLLIGCDPKADSARCLVGHKIPTVLQQLHKKQDNIAREDIMFPGFNGVACIEAGGPEAGVGCAGRGIITMMEELTHLEILNEGWDVVVYDVLGDVVCGGFSVPMREGYADRIYIVTSSEFMSVYAANNIMKAVARSQGKRTVNLGGIIHNQRNGESSVESVEDFAARTATQVLASIPFSREIVLSELEGKTVLEKYPESQTARFFRELAGIIAMGQGSSPEPLSNDELEEFSHYMLDLELQNHR